VEERGQIRPATPDERQVHAEVEREVAVAIR
jgi:hypothetical protein